MDKDRFPFVKIPIEAQKVFGVPDGGTRVYRAEGTEGEAGEWYDAVTAVAGPTVSPGGASMFAPVSRPAVHKRVKEGNLTAFCFHVTRTRKGLFGKQRKARETPFVYVPISELKAWAHELEARMIRLGRVTEEELEGAIPDWKGEFWEWHSEWRKKHSSIREN
ncbi:MAG: hypothetical protein AAF591_18540 [Verrucomicrobiota bacterium]